MRSGHLIFAAIAIAAMASLCMVCDDVDAFGIEGTATREGTENDYGSIHLEAGTYYVEFSYGDSVVLKYADDQSAVIYLRGAVTLSAAYDCKVSLEYYDPSNSPTSFNYFIYEVEKYDVAKKHVDPYDPSADKFSVKAGTMEYFIAGISNPYVSFRLHIGHMDIDLSSGTHTVEIPFDCDVAYLYHDNYDEGDYAYFGYEITEKTYTNKGSLYTGNGSNSSEIYLDTGSYEFEFAISGKLTHTESSDAQFKFVAGVWNPIHITEAGNYSFEYDGYAEGAIPVYFNVKPGLPSKELPSDAEMIDITSSTAYRWYKAEFNLSAGEHNLYSNGSSMNWNFIKGSDAEKYFVDNVINGNITSVPYNIPGALGSNFTLESNCAVVAYTFVKEYTTSVPYYYIDYSISGAIPDLIKGGDDFEPVYIGANKSIKVGAVYDSSKYAIYLVSFDESVLLPSGSFVEVSSVAAKEYSVIPVPLIDDDVACYIAEYQLYTEGAPRPDSLAPLFAVVCIGLCAVFFGLLLYSGRKPKW